MSTVLGGWDWAIIVSYLLGVVGIGIAAGFLRQRGGEGSHYFLAGNTLTWPVINRARDVAFLIEGTGKAQVLHEVLQGPYDPESKPSQLIRPDTGRLEMLLDDAAAAQLPAPPSVTAPYTATLELR